MVNLGIVASLIMVFFVYSYGLRVIELRAD